MTPERGEVWLFDLGMVEKVRPALIVSVAYGPDDRALVTIVPHTTSLRGSAYEVSVKVPFVITGLKRPHFPWRCSRTAEPLAGTR
jgi:mRNA interferase MazF